MFNSANIGPIDRAIRAVMGAMMIIVPYFFTSDLWSNHVSRWGSVFVGAVLIFTALVRFCPLYRLVGANTCTTE